MTVGAETGVSLGAVLNDIKMATKTWPIVVNVNLSLDSKETSIPWLFIKFLSFYCFSLTIFLQHQLQLWITTKDVLIFSCHHLAISWRGSTDSRQNIKGISLPLDCIYSSPNSILLLFIPACLRVKTINVFVSILQTMTIIMD